MTEPEEPQEVGIFMPQEMVGGVWSNFARVGHSPYEFTLDFCRIDFASKQGAVVSRVNLSPLMVTQLWAHYRRTGISTLSGQCRRRCAVAKRNEYVPLKVGAEDTLTTDTEPTAEAYAAQRAMLERVTSTDADRVSLAPLDPETALRALLATPPGER